MRIHTQLHDRALYDATLEAHVTFARFETHGSRTRRFAYDVILSGAVSNRHMNSGRYGALSFDDGYCATWDEWGIFLAQIFDLDPIAHCYAYMGAEDFHYKTGDRFRTLKWADQHPNHHWVASECRCGAVRRWGTLDGYVSMPTAHGFTTSETSPPRSRAAAEAFLASP